MLPHEVDNMTPKEFDDQLLVDPLSVSVIEPPEEEPEFDLNQEEPVRTYTRNEKGELEIPVRLSRRPTVYEGFIKSRIDWCRYCGVTQRAQSAAFRPGPWGKRTLCKYFKII